MQMSIVNAEVRIVDFWPIYSNDWNQLAVQTFGKQTQRTVDLLLDLIQPRQLKREMQRRISYDEGLEKVVKRFIKMIANTGSNKLSNLRI